MIEVEEGNENRSNYSPFFLRVSTSGKEGLIELLKLYRGPAPTVDPFCMFS
jgi:hypothetical protein